MFHDDVSSVQNAARIHRGQQNQAEIISQLNKPRPEDAVEILGQFFSKKEIGVINDALGALSK